MRAARPLMLSEEAGPFFFLDRWMLGEQGAVFASNAGVQAMIRHLPPALCRPGRPGRPAAAATDASRPIFRAFWTLCRGACTALGNAGTQGLGLTSEYFRSFMAASRHFVA